MFTSLIGAFAGGSVLMVVVLGQLLDTDPDPKLPPLIQIGAVAGLVVGLGTVVVTPECPQLRHGPDSLDSASFGPPVRIVIADSPLIDNADAQVIRRVGERDVIVFWTSALSPRAIYLALHQLDAVRQRSGDNAFRAYSYGFRSWQMEMARSRNLEANAETLMAVRNRSR